MTQDGWTQTRHKKAADQKKHIKGCPEADGGAHLYGVVKEIVRLMDEDRDVTWFRSPRCIMCGHIKPRQSMKSRTADFETVETNVYREVRKGSPRGTHRIGLRLVAFQRTYDGNTDFKGRAA